ncbi:hypothetical protein ASG32_27275 [Methylobacterium sp. Leaf361]|uniref:hypothetical protein n=1 Tax=Methylobacterium sp. Leaf361 TaxID=1736352 RepID=UPI000701E2FB|nr:hypothetical protein [Methylobacterium sp. Leaf361]KQS75468.1 hypothetical protein ASG32_27275 [Methylobacterium sp. Leaf361]
MMESAALRRARDAVLLYVYHHGMSRPACCVPQDQVANGCGLTMEQLGQVAGLLSNQGLFNTRGQIGSVCLNEEGQREAERLGPLVPMRDPPAPTSVHVGANYGIVQVGGVGSSQVASQTLDQSQITLLLNRIEQEIPSLNLAPAEKDEAQGILTTLRKVVSEEGAKAGGRLLAAGLVDLLKRGGSALWEQLPSAFHFTAG